VKRVGAIAWVLGLALAAGVAGSASSHKLRFCPEVGTWVPYEIAMSGTMTMSMMGQGGEPLEITLNGRFEDKVVAKSDDGSRTLERTVTALAMTGMGGERDVIADNGGPIVQQLTRDAHGVLTLVGDHAPSELAVNPQDAGSLMHLAFIQLPTPDAEVSEGAEWDSAGGLNVYAGIEEIRAPTKLTSVTTGNPAFAMTACTLHVVSSATLEQPGPDGQAMPIGLDVAQDTQIEQQAALSNGLVAVSKQSGTVSVRIAFRGNPVGSAKIDPFESTVSFDEETWNSRKAGQ